MRKGGALSCVKSEAPVCAARLQMWTCGGVPRAFKRGLGKCSW